MLDKVASSRLELKPYLKIAETCGHLGIIPRIQFPFQWRKTTWGSPDLLGWNFQHFGMISKPQKREFRLILGWKIAMDLWTLAPGDLTKRTGKTTISNRWIIMLIIYKYGMFQVIKSPENHILSASSNRLQKQAKHVLWTSESVLHRAALQSRAARASRSRSFRSRGSGAAGMCLPYV